MARRHIRRGPLTRWSREARKLRGRQKAADAPAPALEKEPAEVVVEEDDSESQDEKPKKSTTKKKVYKKKSSKKSEEK